MTICSCQGKVFPPQFEKIDVKIIHHEICCHEAQYCCVKCGRYLGTQHTYADEDDLTPYSWDDLDEFLTGKEYNALFAKFN